MTCFKASTVSAEYSERLPKIRSSTCTCSIGEMYEFVDKSGFTPVETITCATLNGAKMCHIEGETGSIEAGKCADLLVVNGDVAADIHVLNTDNMDVIMKDGWIVEGGTFGEANKYSA